MAEMFGGVEDEMMVEELAGDDLQPRRNKKKKTSKSTICDEEELEHDVYSFMNSFDRAPHAHCFSLGAPLLQLEYPAEQEQQVMDQYYNQELYSPVDEDWDVYQNNTDDHSKLLEQQNQKVEKFQA